MAPFEYLTAFVTVVVGLAVAHALSGVLRIIEYRETVQADWIPIVWTVSLFVWTVFFWWFTWSRASLGPEELHVLHLFYTLAYAATLYILLGLLHPHGIDHSFDMASHFETNRGWFFSGLLVLAVIDLGDSVWTIVTGLGRPEPLYWIVMITWVVGGLAALRVRERRFNAFYAVTFCVLVTVFTIRSPSGDGLRDLSDLFLGP